MTDIIERVDNLVKKNIIKYKGTSQVMQTNSTKRHTNKQSSSTKNSPKCKTSGITPIWSKRAIEKQ